MILFINVDVVRINIQSSKNGLHVSEQQNKKPSTRKMVVPNHNDNFIINEY